MLPLDVPDPGTHSTLDRCDLSVRTSACSPARGIAAHLPCACPRKLDTIVSFMKLSTVEQALEAMGSMERGKPYSLKPDDSKRKLAQELSSLCRELGISPIIIDGLAVGHHGYARFTADVDILVTREEAALLYRRLKSEPGWKRFAEGFKNTHFDVGLDICVEGDRTSPHSEEVFPNPRDVKTVRVRPLSVIALPALIALKVKSGRARDDADVVELLNRHPAQTASIVRSAARQLSTKQGKARLAELTSRAQAERARRR